jgi:5-methylcytosine-specific restriction endonuclease McrA
VGSLQYGGSGATEEAAVEPVTLADPDSTYLWRHPDGTWHRFAEGQMPPIVPAFSSKRRRPYSKHAASHSPVQIAWPVGGLRAFLLTQAAAMDWRCPYCLDSLRAADGRPAFTAEHIVPLSRGGRHAPLNVVPACYPCNGAKGNMLLSEWRHPRRWWNPA